MALLWEMVRDTFTVIGVLTALVFLFLLWDASTAGFRLRRWQRQEQARKQAHRWKPPRERSKRP